MAHIHCLVIRNRILYRLYIGHDALIDDAFVRINHSTAFFPVDIGRLHSVHRTYSDDTYYKYWAFIAGSQGQTLTPYDKAYYIDYTASKPRRALTDLITKDYTIVIAQYTTRDEASPINITPVSPIVKALAQFHSRGVSTWLNGAI